ncbi:MAG: hypothetical protein HYT03_01820 [Candidatus Harrisonbacteria bacterium]|nr:hypothetical protein [Candidatus Harrisonbacteria bacterium]
MKLNKIVRWQYILGAVIAALIVFGARYLILRPDFIPWEFSAARAKGAAIAEKIVELSRNNLARLSDVSRFDRQRNVSEALISISNAVIENRQTQVEAIRLSSQLEEMAQYISQIRPVRAREFATEAVAAQVALVSRLLFYGDYMSRLFETLRAKFDDPGRAYLDGQVNDLINKLNDEAQAINDLNKRATRALDEFDRVFNN